VFYGRSFFGTITSGPPGGGNDIDASGAELVLRGWFCLVRRLSIRWADGNGVRPGVDGPLSVKRLPAEDRVAFGWRASPAWRS